MQSSIKLIEHYLVGLQSRICQALEEADGGAHFQTDDWQSKHGIGKTRVLEEGAVFEQAGVGFSSVKGAALPEAATAKRPELVGSSFRAMGVSLVLHPKNPYVPTVHMNVRFFIAEKPEGESMWWFGGGYDLTPYYGFEEDCVHWHKTAKAACDAIDPTLYLQFKTWADDYFYLPHRKEPRGIGGIFFDDFNQLGFDRSFEFLQKTGESFLTAYLPIVSKRKNMPYGEREVAFQRYRRGRYVEFNLLYDRGTLFGLRFGGRTESILMSLPPEVSWRYRYQPEAGSPEAALYERYLMARDWV